jgi:hypothetical protein
VCELRVRVGGRVSLELLGAGSVEGAARRDKIALP